MLVYRISKCKYIDDLSGIGASRHPGRWNSKGVQMLYAAQSASLAALESVVHIADLPMAPSYCMATLEIPDELITTLDTGRLPHNWTDYPAPEVLKSLGDWFVRANLYVAMKVPSAVVPEDFNYLLNPLHPAFDSVQIIHQRPFEFDGRLVR